METKLKSEVSNMEQRHELTRQGRLLCDKCKTKLDMYYTPWCPRCEAPKVERIKQINFLQLMTHLDLMGRDGIKDRIWKYFQDECYIRISNDAPFDAHLTCDEDTNEEIQKDLKAIQDYVGEEQIQFYMSW